MDKRRGSPGWVLTRPAIWTATTPGDSSHSAIYLCFLHAHSSPGKEYPQAWAWGVSADCYHPRTAGRVHTKAPIQSPLWLSRFSLPWKVATSHQICLWGYRCNRDRVTLGLARPPLLHLRFPQTLVGDTVTSDTHGRHRDLQPQLVPGSRI